VRTPNQVHRQPASFPLSRSSPLSRSLGEGGRGGEGNCRPALASVLLSLALLPLLTTGCRLDMHDQPKYKPFRASKFFDDGRASRQSVAGTVARGHLEDDEWMYAGRKEGQWAAELPLPVDAALLARGRERYDIYCSPCHARTGDGDGMIVRRGYRRPPSLHDERLRAVPAGHLFDVMTRGFGAMPDYAQQIAARDRWAIVAYIRALQLSRNARIEDVPAGVSLPGGIR